MRKHSGVGLIEVLIAVCVLSIGFLAVAKMQMSGMRYSQNAYFLSQANFMLRDMTDRMRSNSEGVLDGHYDDISTAAGTTNPTCMNIGAKCTPEQLADADLHAWSTYLHAPVGATNFKPLLPSLDSVVARGEVEYDDAANVYTLNVKWGEQVGADVEEQTLTVMLTP